MKYYNTKYHNTQQAKIKPSICISCGKKIQYYSKHWEQFTCSRKCSYAISLLKMSERLQANSLQKGSNDTGGKNFRKELDSASGKTTELTAKKPTKLPGSKNTVIPTGSTSKALEGYENYLKRIMGKKNGRHSGLSVKACAKCTKPIENTRSTSAKYCKKCSLQNASDYMLAKNAQISAERRKLKAGK